MRKMRVFGSVAGRGAPRWSAVASWMALGLCPALGLCLALLACSQNPPAQPAAPEPLPVEEAESSDARADEADEEERAKARARIEEATAASVEGEGSSSGDLTRPVGNSLGSRSLGGGDLSDISNRRPLDQRPIGDGGSLRTPQLNERSHGSVESGDIRDMRGEGASELGDRSLESEHLRDTSRKEGGHGDLGERNWQGYEEEQ
jgi:hypothetical protein